jgi:hypothetical protein
VVAAAALKTRFVKGLPFENIFATLSSSLSFLFHPPPSPQHPSLIPAVQSQPITADDQAASESCFLLLF